MAAKPRQKQRHSVPVLVVLSIFGVAVLFFKFSELLVNARTFRQRTFLKTINNLSDQLTFEEIHNNYDFVQFSDILKSLGKPPYLIFYDSSNVDVVLNHICNLKFIPNALSRLVAISFDQKAQEVLKLNYPSVPSVLIDLQPIIKTLDTSMENRRYVIYTLALVTHAKVCASLALRGIDFWSMHQDTLWIDNFESMEIEDRYPDAFLLFDTVGNELPHYTRMQDWICGATFFVRANPITHQFFQQVTSFMLSYQSPDSSIMTYLCGHHQYRCEFLPRWIVSSFDYFEGPRQFAPVLLQMDAPKSNETKMELFERARFVFRKTDGTCNEMAFRKLRNSVRNGLLERLRKDGKVKESMMKRMMYALKNISNIDPYNRKDFLKIHHSLI
ncbi:unnamed protein product [Caenorhabditis sp. 36 PRJEB53466]|nr:unnamed protein product [Caenorhabditis sp. 36 PRJEB53466]